MTGLPADPAPPVPSVWTAVAETPVVICSQRKNQRKNQRKPGRIKPRVHKAHLAEDCLRSGPGTSRWRANHEDDIPLEIPGMARTFGHGRHIQITLRHNGGHLTLGAFRIVVNSDVKSLWNSIRVHNDTNARNRSAGGIFNLLHTLASRGKLHHQLVFSQEHVRKHLNGVKEPTRGRIRLAHRDADKSHLATSPVRNSTAHRGQPFPVILRI